MFYLVSIFYIIMFKIIIQSNLESLARVNKLTYMGIYHVYTL